MSKTVKRVSKTVKRVMTVMVIGMVAMLGVEAEAHWIVAKGLCVWHSGECVRKDKDVPDPPIPILDPANPATFPPEVELVASVTKFEILCPGAIVETHDFSSSPVTLTTREPIDQGDITISDRVEVDPDGNSIPIKNLEVERIVSDALFLQDDPDEFNFCSNQSPEDVIIREMKDIEMNLYCFDANCSGASVRHSAWQADTCTLSSKFKLTNYPKYVPPRGAPFYCAGTERCHPEQGVEVCTSL